MRNGLVFIKNEKVVTDSLTVAQSFGKEHARVMRDIRELECSEEFRVGNFAESTYTNNQERQYPMYYITQDGFTLLVMGYTGKTAMQFKEKYIKEFRRMEEDLKQPKALSERDQLVATMKLSLESTERLDGVEKEVGELKTRFDNELTLKHGQATSLNHAVKQRVEKLWKSGTRGTLESKQQMYSNIYSQMKRAFHAPTYREIKRKDFAESIKWVGAWRPL